MTIVSGSDTENSTSQAHSLKLHRDYVFGEVSNSAYCAQLAAISPICKTGTEPAIYYPTSGGPTLSAKKIGRGGARNRADRESYLLTIDQIANLRAAKTHADKIGLPFTRMITIHWQAAGVPLTGMVKATGRFTDLLAKSLARRGKAVAWLWVHENCGPKGGHCHLLAHVPTFFVARLTTLQIRWLRQITGHPYRARVIRSRPIGGRLGLEASNPALHAVNLEAALSYILKGASREAADKFLLERVKLSGRVVGKRCGTSQNIGAKARSAKG